MIPARVRKTGRCASIYDNVVYRIRTHARVEKMDWVSVQVPAAIIAGIVSLVGGLITAAVTLGVARQRATVDEKLATLKGSIDGDLATRRAAVDEKLAQLKGELDQRTLFQAERVARELMEHPEFDLRSFAQIRHHIGGFDDETLRIILVRAGALRFGPIGGPLFGPGGDSSKERWGLIERNRHLLKKKPAGEQVDVE
jgi:hypothetical protein